MAHTGGSSMPDWHIPPTMIGGYVAGPVLIARSDRALVAARQILAYPAGVEIEVEAHGRGTWRHPMPRPDGPPVGPAGFPDDPHDPPLRFRITFGDGRGADLNDDAGLRSGRGPTVHSVGSMASGGGPAGDEDLRITLWVWPLPPSGPFTVACWWPAAGLEAREFILDGDAVGAAAMRAEPFWPDRD